MSFTKLGLRAELLDAVRVQGYDQPTPIQLRAIPVVLAGRDLMAAAQTGTGKTAGFTLPMLQLLMEAPQSPDTRRGAPSRPVRALILTPTRELAAQVATSVRTYGGSLPLRSTVIYGGVGMEPQIQALRRGTDIVIATPGRLLDHMRSGRLDLSRVEILVLDEADRMLDMGFLPDIKRILAKLPAKRQNLLFSATFSDPIRELASRLLDRPELIEVAPRNSTAENVDQCFYRVERDLKPALLAQLIQHGSWSQVLVFTRTKHGADRLARRLQRDGITTAAIHGNKSQNARTRALDDLKQNRVRVLVATDIAARGLDIQGLPHVVNFDMPHVPEDYVHRIGRTARAGASGQAVSLVGSEERKLLRDIERLLGAAVREERLEGFASAGAPSGFRGGERASETPRSPASRHRSAAVPPPHGVDGAAPARTEVRSEGERTGPAPGRLRPARRRRSLAGAR